VEITCNFQHAVNLRVRYGETDQMGYCYYGNYASYFEVGRVEAMRSLGMSYRKLEEDGVMLPVSHFEIDYFKPALYDDELTVVTTITGVKGPRLYFEYLIFNADQVKLCFGKTTLVFVSKENMRPIAAPEQFLAFIKQHQKQKND
jgi:acyl-CoA thioester hydrolase